MGFVGDQVEPPKALPEPATLGLLGLAALAAGVSRRRKTA
ncbi:MAG: PEP-CTERM sorting domain-containing protein [Burkholderiaceae bacterium]|nr:PEP-CTERM sorting domain-containing protein [Burkholderiaceae bacterium]